MLKRLVVRLGAGEPWRRDHPAPGCFHESCREDARDRPAPKAAVGRGLPARCSSATAAAQQSPNTKFCAPEKHGLLSPRPPAAYGGPVALSTASAVACGSPVLLAVSPAASLLFCLKRLAEFATTQLFSAEQTPPREGHGGSRQPD